MKVLIIGPKLPTIAIKEIGLPTNPFGGWIDGLLSNLSKYKDLQIHYLTINKNNDKTILIDNIYFHYTNNLHRIFEIDFDVVHIFGIEHSYLKKIYNYLDYDKTLLYIAGLQFVYEQKYYANFFNYYNTYNPLLFLGMWLQKEIMKKGGTIEKYLLKKGKYVTGRTFWDKKYALQINPQLKYYKCNESLRFEFYNAEKWNINEINKHSIFVTQAAYSIKAAHIIIEIVRKLKNKYPDIICNIAGENILESTSMLTKMKSSYAYAIKSSIKKYSLENNIKYVGFANANQVISYLKHSNCYLSSAVIENSCNSLQEAMLLGTPCVSSKVGGLESIAKDGENVLFYDFDDIEKAVENISRIFDDEELCLKLSHNSINHIEKLADPKVNADTMHNIYIDIYRRNNHDSK